MAFTTTQSLDNVLLRNISFRTTANNAISSTYGLYANGQGQTYWSNTVSPQNLSTLSTSLSLATISLSTTISTVNANTNSNLSSIISTIALENSNISTLDYALYSSVTSLIGVDQTLSNSIVSLSNGYFALSNSLAMRVDNIYTSTINMVYSTLYGYSSFSTFYSEIGAVQSSVNTSVSSLSTALALQNISTYNALTINYTLADTLLAASTTQYINQQISSISSVLATGANLSTFSSIITQQLLSTSQGNVTNFLSAGNAFTQQLSTIYNSSIKYLESTNVTNTSNISNLLNLSSLLSTTSYYWISSFVSTNNYYQNLTINSNLSNLSTSVSSLWASSILLTRAFSSISSIYVTNINNQQSTNTGLQKNISDLQYQFSIITTSSILAGIYDTFYELQFYTSTLIGSTIETTAVFQSTLYYSTTLQNMSISQQYFNYYVSTLYASTLSTLVPSTFSYMSTLVSTLYSTGNVYLFSTLNSTSQGIATQFISTTSSLAQTLISSTQSYANSSIVGYVALPTAAALSSFSTAAGTSLNTFSTTGMSQISTQSSLFNTIYTSTNVLYISSANLYNTLNNFYINTIAQTGTLLSTFSTQSQQQLSTQNAQFNSTLATYPNQLTSSVTSTNAAVYSATSVAAASTLTSIQNSTLAAFNLYASSLLTATSSIGLSSLYTVQSINLSGSTFNGVMDMGSYRNFNVNIFNLSNGMSDYQLNYTSNVLSFMDYRRGVITLNISTVGQSYTNNSSLLHFNVYRWGLPTTVFGSIYPYLSNADYSIQYEYTIINRMIYTNLLNVFPRISVRNAQIVPIVQNVSINGTPSSSYFWRGTSINVSWSNYSYFPYGRLGTPPFNPEIEIDVIVGGNVVSQYFVPFNQSSITIQAPYLTNQTVPVIPTSVNAYIVGSINDVTTNSFFTVLPTFDNVFVSAQSPVFAGGQELVAVTDDGRYPLAPIVPIIYTTNSSNFTSYSNDPQYSAQKLTNGLLNTTGATGYTLTNLTVGASNIAGQFQENSAASGFADFYINIPGYFAPLNTLQAFNSQITFTIRNILNSYTFTGTNIVAQGGTLYRVYNTGVPKLSNTFTSGAAQISYSYSPVFAISSFIGFTESSFVGPTSAGNPDPAVTVQIQNLGLTTLMDPVSSLTFYNIINGPITSNQTAGMTIVGSVSYGGNQYASTFNVTNATSAQTFRI